MYLNTYICRQQAYVGVSLLVTKPHTCMLISSSVDICVFWWFWWQTNRRRALRFGELAASRVARRHKRRGIPVTWRWHHRDTCDALFIQKTGETHARASVLQHNAARCWSRELRGAWRQQPQRLRWRRLCGFARQISRRFAEICAGYQVWCVCARACISACMCARACVSVLICILCRFRYEYASFVAYLCRFNLYDLYVYNTISACITCSAQCKCMNMKDTCQVHCDDDVPLQHHTMFLACNVCVSLM